MFLECSLIAFQVPSRLCNRLPIGVHRRRFSGGAHLEVHQVRAAAQNDQAAACAVLVPRVQREHKLQCAEHLQAGQWVCDGARPSVGSNVNV
eukprot:338486-Pyramimonas_sp.AAC.1